MLHAVPPGNASPRFLDPARIARPGAGGRLLSGDTLEVAVFATEELEETAKLHLLLRGLNPRSLSPKQAQGLVRVGPAQGVRRRAAAGGPRPRGRSDLPARHVLAMVFSP